MHNGYIKLWRKFTETSFFKDSKTVHLAIYLLIKSNHEPRQEVLGGKLITVLRGQCVTRLPEISSTTGISIQSLRTAFTHLINCGFLTGKSTNKNRLISIGRYSDYQDKSTGRLTAHQQTTNRQLTDKTSSDSIIIDSPYKNERTKEEEHITDFETFWKAYPKKKARKDALRAWHKNTPPLDGCLKTLEWQKKEHDWLKEGGKYIPYPASWLNAERWHDEAPKSKYIHPDWLKPEPTLPQVTPAEIQAGKDRYNAIIAKRLSK